MLVMYHGSVVFASNTLQVRWKITIM